jgi:hypothetical protein
LCERRKLRTESRHPLADYHAISAVGQAIVAMLASAARTAATRKTVPDLAGAAFEVASAKRLAEAATLEKGIYLFLYRVQISGARHQLPQRVDPVTREPLLHPLALDLFYVLTAAAPTVELQHVLLGWAMREIENAPVLVSALLNVRHEGAFRPEEAVELVHDPLSLEDLASIWRIFQNGFETCATYVARLVPIDSDLTIAQARPVRARIFGRQAEGR